MPRGVYDRKKSAKNGATKTSTPKLTKSGKPRRRRRTKAEMEAARATSAGTTVQAKATRGRKKGAVAKAGRPVKIATKGLQALEQFAIVRENIVALSQVRASSKTGVDMNALDNELQNELALMSVLRIRYFGDVQEVSGEGAQTGNVSRSTVPLPPRPPQIQPPPPQSA